MNLKGSKTKENLLKAFMGESQARNKYTYFASVAKNENYSAISAIFEETANHEKEHAKRLFKFLDDGEELNLSVCFPAGKIGTTLENLIASMNGEHEEESSMYPEFAKIAKEEGFTKIAYLFEAVGKIEKGHEERYETLLKSLTEGKIFERPTKVIWECGNCGHMTRFSRDNL